MITYNFMTTITSIFRGSSESVPVKNYNGTKSTIFSNYIRNGFGSDLLYKTYPESNWDGCYLLIGSGDSPESADAYKLDTLITQYTVLNQNHVFSSTYGGDVLLINRVIENTSDEAFTVKEVGLFGTNYMIAREVLTEPVTVQPGEKHTFTMTIGLSK